MIEQMAMDAALRERERRLNQLKREKAMKQEEDPTVVAYRETVVSSKPSSSIGEGVYNVMQPDFSLSIDYVIFSILHLVC